jgi:hypothetical protein
VSANARDIVLTLQVDIAGTATTFVTLDGTNEKITLSKYLDTFEMGHASDTTIARASAGVISVEGNNVYIATGTDVAVTDGGTGVGTLTDGGVLLGSGTSAITAMAVLADGSIIVGDGTTDPVALAAFSSSTGDLNVTAGGTGAGTFTDGGVLLGSGTSALTAMAVLTDGQMIVGDGTTDPVAESGATLRTSIGVGTGDSPQFTGIELGHANDTTIARSAAGAATVEGDTIILSGDTLIGEVTATFDTDGSTATTIADSVAVSSWTLTTPTITSGATFTDADISPDAPGELVYDNTVTGYGDGLFAIRYVVDFEASDLPGVGEDDYVLAYDAVNDKNYWKADADAGGAPTLDNVASPAAAWSIAMQNGEQIAWDIQETDDDAIAIRATGNFGDIR